MSIYRFAHLAAMAASQLPGMQSALEADPWLEYQVWCACYIPVPKVR